MIVEDLKMEIERIVDDLIFTAGQATKVAATYKRSLQEHPEQTQWREVIGRAKGRADLALQIADKLKKIIQD